MDGIRPFTRDDIPPVVELHARSFGPHARLDELGLQAYFREMFFDHPWYDEDFPSFGYEKEGEIVAFVGILPRPMEFRGEPIRVLVVSQLMADPERCPALVPLKLLKQLFAGPQDLILTDGATREVGKLWVAAGGSSAPLYDFHWKYAIRPARAFMDRVAQRSPGLGWYARGSRPLTWIADSAIRRILDAGQEELDQFEARPLEPGVILDELPRMKRRFPLIPSYDKGSLAWILEHASEKQIFGPLYSSTLWDGDGELSGWHLRYQAPGGPAEVLQIYARPKREAAVFGHLVQEARAAGAPLVKGRTEPSLAWAIADARGRFAPGAPVTLCHSRRPELLSALRGGQAFFTRLEGEWWQRFAGG